jgi:Fur family ferric uptake transcriptional regulator
MTYQRQVILEELAKVTSHPTAYDLHKMVNKRLPKISLGTVYRNLELLSESNEIQRLDVSGHQRRFDANAKDHHHIRCIHCSRVDDLPIDTTSVLEDIVFRTSEYTVLGHKIEFYGICPECKVKEQKHQEKDDISKDKNKSKTRR